MLLFKTKKEKKNQISIEAEEYEQKSKMTSRKGKRQVENKKAAVLAERRKLRTFDRSK